MESITLVQNRKEQLEIKVEDFENVKVFIWSPEKFKERLQMMKDLIAQYAEQGSLPEISDFENPFYDEPEPIFIGEGYYSL